MIGLFRPCTNCLFKGLPIRLRFFGLYYQTLLGIWYYERLWQVWDLNCSDCWYAGLKFWISTLLRKFIPVVFAVQSAVQCVQFKHKNLFIDFYLSYKIRYLFRLKCCHHQADNSRITIFTVVWNWVINMIVAELKYVAEVYTAEA